MFWNGPAAFVEYHFALSLNSLYECIDPIARFNSGKVHLHHKVHIESVPDMIQTKLLQFDAGPVLSVEPFRLGDKICLSKVKFDIKKGTKLFFIAKVASEHDDGKWLASVQYNEREKENYIKIPSFHDDVEIDVFSSWHVFGCWGYQCI